MLFFPPCNHRKVNGIQQFHAAYPKVLSGKAKKIIKEPLSIPILYEKAEGL
jgi:hypothetical protein